MNLDPSTLPTHDDGTAFDAALLGQARHLELADGRRLPLAVARWRGTADEDDRWLLQRCQGPTVDLGCGPGRLVAALVTRGVRALGVDTSPVAVRQCRERGVSAVHQDAFSPLPEEGRWRHVLLADGNIGIGGNPVALLRRAARLLRHGGSVLIETSAPRTALWSGGGRLRNGPTHGPWFPWAVVGLDAVATLARSAGLRLTATHHTGHRYFAELVGQHG
jgi:SAM-dependent methyltransferase